MQKHRFNYLFLIINVYYIKYCIELLQMYYFDSTFFSTDITFQL